MNEKYFDENGELCLVQYAIKIRERGTPEEELIKHYSEVPIEVAKEVNDCHGCGQPEGEEIIFKINSGIYSLGKVRFFKGRIGSIELIVSKENAKDAIHRLFNNEVSPSTSLLLRLATA